MNMGLPELLIVLIVVLPVFGPGRLVKVSRELGAGDSSAQDLAEIAQTLQELASEFKSSAGQLGG